MSTSQNNAEIAKANRTLLAKLNRRLDKVVIENWAPDTLEDKAEHDQLTKTEKRDHKVWSHRTEPTTRLMRKGVWAELPVT